MQMDKSELRKEIKRRFKESSPDDRCKWSEELCQRLLGMEALQKAHVVMGFYSLPDEADIRPLLEHLAKDGKTVLLPEVTGETTMILRRYSPDAEMVSGSLGTKVPSTDIFSDYDKIDTILVPGVAFDKEGHRMGRGKGYYDRFLALLPTSSIKIGVCFPYQIVELVPFEEHDFVMDYV